MARWRYSALFIGIFSATQAYAGAWTQPPGHGLFIAQATYFSANSYFDENGLRTAQPRFSKWELQPYVEYGIKPWLTLGGSALLHHVGQSGDENYGIGDPEIFTRIRLWQGEKQVMTLQPLVKWRSYYSDRGLPRGSSRSTDLELSLLYGRNLHIFSPRDYADLRAGYRLRSRSLNPQWRMDAAIGVSLSEHWQLIPAMRYIAAAALDDNAMFRQDGEQDYDLLKAECALAYHLNRNRWLQATVFEHLAGVQTGAGRGFSIGIAERF